MTDINDERLAAIEELPLEERAQAYEQIHDELLAELEASDSAQ